MSGPQMSPPDDDQFYTSYTGSSSPYYSDVFNAATSSQKLEPPAASTARGKAKRRPSASQRLVLALVSLVLWLLFFLGIVLGFHYADQTHFYTLEGLLCIGLLFFTILEVVINMVFNGVR